METRTLSKIELFLLAVTCAVVTANAYYLHPIIARIAEDFGVSDAMIGAVPALNQVALALGIFLLLPLGDRFSNRRLVSLFVALQFLSLVVMAFAEDFIWFVAGSTILGFFTIAPYLLPAYVSKRVEPEQLGRATAALTTGIIAGILLARTGGGFVGEHFGWRSVYFVAASLMFAVSLLVPFVMDERRTEDSDTAHRPSSSFGESQGAPMGYVSLILSIVSVVRSHPDILRAGAIQGSGFGIFLIVWLGLSLHLTSPEMGYGVDVVGYLAAISAFNLLVTPRLGAWADRTGARKARLLLSKIYLLGVVLLLFTGSSLWLLLIPLIIMNLVGPVIDITGRMTFLNQPPEIRTRLMTVYIIMMFIGGGMASWAGTATYDWFGWTGTALLSSALGALVLGFSWLSLHRHPV